MTLPDVVPLFASLLSIPLAAPYAPVTLPPQRQRQKTLEALLSLVRAMAIQQPTVFLVEDLHWADPSTLELLTLLIEPAPPPGLLTLLTFRPDFTPPWGTHPHLVHLALGRFDGPDVEGMVQRVAGGKALPAELLRQIALKTDGVPLFIEELTKMLLESGALRPVNGHYELTGPVSALAIPTTLHDSLMARLDRLSSVKEVAQMGATIGREFSYELLHAVSPRDESVLRGELARLVEAGLVSERGTPPQANYLFKHALIQDAAYQSLLKAKRQQYHPQIARVLEERFPETVETQPELLAHHYTAAGLNEQAIPYWERAGQRAIARSANLEAIAHLTKGLELLQALPNTPIRAQHELTLQVTLSVPLMAVKGWAAPEVERVSARARELCQQVGEPSRLVAALWGLWNFYIVRGRLQTAQELADQFIRLADGSEDRALLLRAHYTVGDTFFWLGELARARAHLEQEIALDDPQDRRQDALIYGLDPGVACLSHAAWTLWLLGYPNHASTRISQAASLARELQHPASSAWALYSAAVLHQKRGEANRVEHRAEALIALSTEHGFPHWTVLGNLLRGWAVTAQGRGQEVVVGMRQAITTWRAMGAELSAPYYLALLAETYGNVGNAEAGLSALAEALAAVNETGERWYEAELYRLKGTLLMALFAEDQADACFRQAVDVARRHHARMLELRATVSLGRLLQRQSRMQEARERLTGIYGWFTEGFDTKELREARTLLDELESSGGGTGG